MRALLRRGAMAPWATVFVAMQLGGAGCGQLVGNPHPPKESSTDKRSSIHISLTDAPVDDAEHLYVSFARFALWHTDSEAWIDLNLSVSERVDILALQGGKTTPFGFHADIPSGNYAKMLIQLDTIQPATLVYKNGEEQVLSMVGDASGATEHDIFLEIAAGEVLNYTVDFDVRKSIVPMDVVEMSLVVAEAETVLAPRYRLVADNEVGTVSGEGEPGDVICLYAIDGKKDQDEHCLGSVNSGVVDADGKYTVPFMPEGDYGVRIFKESGDFIDGEDATVKVPAPEKTPQSAEVKSFRRPYQAQPDAWHSRPKSRNPQSAARKPDMNTWWNQVETVSKKKAKSNGQKKETSQGAWSQADQNGVEYKSKNSNKWDKYQDGQKKYDAKGGGYKGKSKSGQGSKAKSSKGKSQYGKSSKKKGGHHNK